MLSATVEQVEQTVNKIAGLNEHLSFKEQMSLVKNYFLNTIGAYQIAEEIFHWIDKISISGIQDKILKTGNSAPDFTLASSMGKIVNLKKYLRRGPVVVIFYRGIWCPFCALYLKTIQRRLFDMRKLRTSVMAISPQTPDNSMIIADKYNLEFEILSDIGNMVTRKFGLVYRMPENILNIYRYIDVFLSSFNGDDSHELPIAATYIINRAGIIERAFINIDFMHRPDPEKIIDVLAGMR